MFSSRRKLAWREGGESLLGHLRVNIEDVRVWDDAGYQAAHQALTPSFEKDGISVGVDKGVIALAMIEAAGPITHEEAFILGMTAARQFEHAEGHLNSIVEAIEGEGGIKGIIEQLLGEDKPKKAKATPKKKAPKAKVEKAAEAKNNEV